MPHHPTLKKIVFDAIHFGSFDSNVIQKKLTLSNPTTITYEICINGKWMVITRTKCPPTRSTAKHEYYYFLSGHIPMTEVNRYFNPPPRNYSVF